MSVYCKGIIRAACGQVSCGKRVLVLLLVHTGKRRYRNSTGSVDLFRNSTESVVKFFFMGLTGKRGCRDDTGSVFLELRMTIPGSVLLEKEKAQRNRQVFSCCNNILMLEIAISNIFFNSNI